MPAAHGPPGSLWYSISPRILPHSVFISRSTLLASSVGIGRGSESTEGGGETRGDVGRDDARFINRLLLDFLSLDAAGICSSSGRGMLV